MSIQDQPPASILLYLFADQTIPADTAMTAGVEVPCAGAKVQKEPLATGIAAVALWNLARHGLVALHVDQRKRLGMFTARSVMVSPTGSGPTAGPLEGQLFALLANGGPRSARQVMYEWFADDWADPAAHLVTQTQYTALALGAFTEVTAHHGDVSSYQLARGRLEPVCRRREELRPAAQELLEQWQTFRTANAELAAQLEADVRKGIRARRESPDHDFGSGGDFD